jgi:hypothetical protein
MTKRNMLLITALIVLIIANMLMIVLDSPAFVPNAEGFAAYMQNSAGAEKEKEKEKEAFSNYAAGAAGAKGAYIPMGQFDGLTVKTGNSSAWRYTSPNESLTAPAEEVGPDNLFMFKNNQCKPSCCGSSYSCGGGCVCTTPEQRDYINSRGGNRTKPESGV